MDIFLSKIKDDIILLAITFLNSTRSEQKSFNFDIYTSTFDFKNWLYLSKDIDITFYTKI